MHPKVLVQKYTVCKSVHLSIDIAGNFYFPENVSTSGISSGVYFDIGPSEVRATSGANLGRALF